MPRQREPAKKPAPKKEAPKKRLTVAQQAKRNADMIVDKATAMTWPMVAAKYGMSERQAQNIYYAWRDEAMDASSDDAIGLAFDYNLRYEAIEQVLASILLDAKENAAVRVGAARTLLAATNERRGLDQALGKLPRNMGALRVELDMRHTSQVIVEVLRRYDVPNELMADLSAALRGKKPKALTEGN